MKKTSSVIQQRISFESYLIRDHRTNNLLWQIGKNIIVNNIKINVIFPRNNTMDRDIMILIHNCNRSSVLFFIIDKCKILCCSSRLRIIGIGILYMLK